VVKWLIGEWKGYRVIRGSGCGDQTFRTIGGRFGQNALIWGGEGEDTRAGSPCHDGPVPRNAGRDACGERGAFLGVRTRGNGAGGANFIFRD
jgi:hypothetical protein